jgi:hypothetical protein
MRKIRNFITQMYKKPNRKYSRNLLFGFLYSFCEIYSPNKHGKYTIYRFRGNYYIHTYSHTHTPTSGVSFPFVARNVS